MAVIARFAWAFGVGGAVAWAGALAGAYVAGAWAGPPTHLALFGTALLVAWAALDAARLGRAARSRAFRLGSGSVLLQGVALVLAVGFYAVVDERLDRTFDLTRRRTHSLSSHTVEVLRSIEEPVEIVAFMEEGTPQARRFARLVDLYTQTSDLLRLQWVDLIANPVRARQEEVTGPTVILRRGDREERLEVDFTETELTRQLILVLADEEHVVCWSVGHGEADPDDDVAPDGYGAAVLALEGTHVQVLNVQIAGEGIPDDCELLVVARPRAEWLPWEREALAAYVGAGGQALILLDPMVDTPGFNADLERFGVEVYDDVVFDGDPASNLAGMAGALAIHGDGVLAHPITDPLVGAVILPVARSLGLPKREGLFVRELLRTTALGWGETDLDDPVVEPDEGVDRTGRLPLAVVAEVKDPTALDVVLPAKDASPDEDERGRLVPTDWTGRPGGRLVVVGDADFPTNQFIAFGSNQDFFLNAVAWLLGEEAQLGERPELAEPLELSERGSALLCLFSVVVVPGGAGLLALIVLLRRRWGGAAPGFRLGFAFALLFGGVGLAGVGLLQGRVELLMAGLLFGLTGFGFARGTA